MSGLFGKKSQSATANILSGIRISRNVYGDCVPLLYGTQRISGTIIWYGDFLATPASSNNGGKGGHGSGTSSAYNYSAALEIALCEAPSSGSISIYQIYADKALTSTTDLTLTPKSGTDGTVWSYLTSAHPTQAVPYDHTYCLASSSFDLGSSAAMPNMTYEVSAIAAYSNYDADCPEMVTDYLTDANHGAGFHDSSGTSYLDSTGIATTTANSWGQYCGSLGFFLSPWETTQRAASDFINEACEITNSAPVWRANKLTIVPHCDMPVSATGFSYTPNMTPLFDFGDDDYINSGDGLPVTVTRKAPSQRYNKVRVEFLNRNNQYNADIAEAFDAADIDLNGERVMQTLTYHSVTLATVARQVAQLRLQRELFVINVYEFKLQQIYCGLEPMDIVAISDKVLGLSNQLVRITQVDESDTGEITITAEEIPLGNAAAPVYNWADAQGYAANYNISPGSVSQPLLFSAPPLLVNVNSGGYELWIAAAGTNSEWGGCTVHASFDGTTYRVAGVIHGPARYGYLASSISSVTDPDSTTTLTVDMLAATQQLNPATKADADGARSLIYVGGEIMSFENCTLSGTNQYQLSYLRRALYGSTNAAHSAGSSSAPNFARLDDRILKLPFDNGNLGATVYLKFTSFNIYGGAEEELSAVTAYTKTLTAASVSLGSGADGQSVYVQFSPDTTSADFHDPPYVPGTDLYMRIKVGTGAYSAAILISGAGATGATGPAGATGAPGPAIWTPILSSNMSQTGAASFTKTGSTNAWDAQVYSAEVYPACFVTFTVPNNTHDVAVGLSLVPTTDASYASINFAWVPSNAGTAAIYESGTSVASGITYAANDVFAITYDGFIVRYLHNGKVVRGVPAILQQFYLDSSFYQGSSGSSVSKLSFGVLAQTPLSESGPGNFLHTAQWADRHDREPRQLQR